MNIEVQGQTLRLLKEKALFWEDKKTLILSDVHLGKAESLQSEGIAMPAEAGASDLERMETLMRDLYPERVLIVGDFVHAANSWSLDLRDRVDDFFCRWQETEFRLIVGNHERGSLHSLEKFDLHVTEGPYLDEPFIFHHGHARKAGPHFTIEGHLHPIVKLREGPLKLRMPCFVLEEGRMVLPAFGVWTGGIEPEANVHHRYFAVGPREVFEVDRS